MSGDEGAPLAHGLRRHVYGVVGAGRTVGVFPFDSHDCPRWLQLVEGKNVGDRLTRTLLCNTAGQSDVGALGDVRLDSYPNGKWNFRVRNKIVL